MTVKQLKRFLDGVPDDMTVMLYADCVLTPRSIQVVPGSDVDFFLISSETTLTLERKGWKHVHDRDDVITASYLAHPCSTKRGERMVAICEGGFTSGIKFKRLRNKRWIVERSRQ